MLEWVCPKCNRLVDPAFDTCPFCHEREAEEATRSPKPAAQPPRPTFWEDVERGFRLGLGFVAVLAVVYFVLFLVAYFQGRDDWLARLTHWLHLH